MSTTASNPNAYAAGQEEGSGRALTKTGSLTEGAPCLAEHPVLRRLPNVVSVLAVGMPAAPDTSGIAPMVRYPMRFSDTQVEHVENELKNSTVDSCHLLTALGQNHLLGTPPLKKELVMNEVNSMEDLDRQLFKVTEKGKIKYGEVEPRNYLAPEMAHSGAIFFQPQVAHKLKQIYESENQANMPFDPSAEDTAFARHLDTHRRAQREIDDLFGGDAEAEGEQEQEEEAEEEEAEEELAAETIDDVGFQFVPPALPSRAPAATQRPQEGQEQGGDDDDAGDRYASECDKVTGLLVRLHEEGDPETCAGFILYLLVHDPLWNAGAGIEDLLEISRHGRSSERSRRFFKSMTPQGHMAREMQIAALEETHILRNFDRESYHMLAACYNPEATEASGHVPMGKSLRNEDHPLHPCRIFTPQRALEVVRHFNPRIDLSDLERHSPDLLARLPGASPLFPYHRPIELPRLHPRVARLCWAVPHTQLLWRHPSKIGMAFQFLPWEDGHIEVKTRQFDAATGRRIYLSSRSVKEEQEHRARQERVACGGVLKDWADPRKRREQTLQHLARERMPSSFMVHMVPKEKLNWFYAAQARFGVLRTRTIERRPPVLSPIKRGFALGGPTLSKKYSVHHRRQLLEDWLKDKHAPYSETVQAVDRKLLNFFSARLWTTEAILPAAIKSIIYWQKHGGGMLDGKHQGNGEPGFTDLTERLHFSDARLDLGANHILNRAAHMRELDRASPQVMPHILLMSFAAYDRHDATPGMKINVIAHGEKSTGKSFMQELTEKYSIRGSIQKRSSESTRANNFVVDYSDAVFMFDELSPDWKANVKDGEKSAEFKEASVAGVVVRYVNAPKGRDGSEGRQQEAITTYYNTTWYLNSNIPINLLEDAVRSRTLTIVFMDYGNDGRLAGSSTKRSHSILDYMLHDSEKEVQRTERDYKQERWVEHALTAMYFKAVESRALPEIDMRVCRYVVYKMLGVYRQHGVSTGSVRNYTRIERLARLITAVQAQKYAFCNPHDHCTVEEAYGERFRAKRHFTTEQLHRLKPFLVCSMQTAVFAFSMLAYQYLDPLMGFVFEGMLRLIDYPVEAQRRFLERQEEQATRRDAIPAIDGYRSYALLHYMTYAGNRERAIWRRSGPDSEFLNLDYVRVTSSSISDLANHLVAKLTPKPAKEDIESVLYDMTRMAVELPSHQLAASHGFEDHLPEVRRRKVRIMEQSFEGGSSQSGIYICPAALLALSNRALLEKAVRSLAYKGMRTPRTFLLNGEGCGEVDPQQLNFSTITLTEADCSQKRASSTFRIASASYMERRDRIGIFASRFYKVDGEDEAGTDDRDALPNMGPDRHAQARLRRDRVRANADEQDRSTDDQERGEQRQRQQQQQREASYEEDEEASLPYYEEMQRRLGLSHTKREIKIEQDLDDWAVTNYFAEHGLPLCVNPDDESDLSLYWRYTTASGRVVRRPLPTAHAMQQEAIRQVRTNERYRKLYNSQYVVREERGRRLAPASEPSPVGGAVAAAAAAASTVSGSRAGQWQRPPQPRRRSGSGSGSENTGTQRAARHREQEEEEEDLMLLDTEVDAQAGNEESLAVSAGSDVESSSGGGGGGGGGGGSSSDDSASLEEEESEEAQQRRRMRKRQRKQEHFLPAKEARLHASRAAPSPERLGPAETTAQ